MQNFSRIIHDGLRSIYSKKEINTFTYLLLEKITGLTKTQLLVQNRLVLNKKQRKVGEEFIERLKTSEPIQYILGEVEFYGLRFKVNSAALIPRPETEELVEWIVDDLNHCSTKATLLDIGTGTGCIPISLKKKFNAISVSAIDLSGDALALAHENAEINCVDIHFIQDDILCPKIAYGLFDILVSNPPYIPVSERKNMDANVVNFEPSTALFVPDDDALVFYRKIAEFALQHLKRNGTIYFETHYDQAQSVKSILEDFGFNHVEVRKDMAGMERMVKGTAFTT
ncbi:MAG: peptide chain release factor N(5)-glutamine methyltransferase [Paludibacteraceae bacterium]